MQNAQRGWAVWLRAPGASMAGHASHQWNCAFSVEPVSASVDDAPAVTTLLTASK